MAGRMSTQEKRDVFREIPLRYLGYANEVGESFRHVVPVRFVHLSYVVASGYVATHAASRGLKTRQQVEVSTLSQAHKQTSATSPSYAVLDTLIWQGLASVVVPGLTINRVCAVSRFLLARHAGRLLTQHVRRWATTGVGLGSIPFIIHPIDRTVDGFMDWLVRPWLLSHLTSTALS